MWRRLSSRRAPLSHVPGVSTTRSSVVAREMDAPGATVSPGRMGASFSSRVATCTSQRSVTEERDRFATKASRPRRELPVALLPLPVWPTSTIVSFLGADMATRRAATRSRRARDRGSAHLRAAADDQIPARRRGTQTTGVSEGAPMTTASHFFSFSRINTKCTLCVHTGAKRSTLGARAGIQKSVRARSLSKTLHRRPFGGHNDARRPSHEAAATSDRARSTDCLHRPTRSRARRRSSPGRTPDVPPAPRFNIPRIRLVRDASSS